MPAASTVAAFSVKTIGKTQFEMQKVAFLRKIKTLSSFITGQNFSTISVSDLLYSHKKYG